MVILHKLDELSEELKQKVTEFVQAAKSLEDYIVAHNQGSKPLHDQVAELREILEQKNQLIIDCEQRLQNWKERLNMLKDEQQQLLYDQV